jgi:hypothetical protein
MSIASESAARDCAITAPDFARNTVRFDPTAMVIHHKRFGEWRIDYSLSQIRVLLLALSKVRQESDLFEPIAFTREEFVRALGIRTNRLAGKEMIAIIDSLLGLRVSYQQVSPRYGKGTGRANVFSRAEYFPGLGIVGLKLNDDVAPVFTGLSANFVRYRLAHVLACSSVYAIRLYILLRPHRGFRNGRKFSIAQLRDTFAIPDGVHKSPAHFRTHVIEPAVRQINQRTDLRVSATPIKEGRRHSGYHFAVRSTKHAPGHCAVTGHESVQLPFPIQFQADCNPR